MLDRLTGKPVHVTVQWIAMMGLAAGLPTSKIPLSLGTMLLGLNVILLWDWSLVWKRWISSRWLLFLFAYIALELLSIAWSGDKANALDMIRKEMPLYTIPLSITALPLEKKQQYKWIAFVFVLAVFITSFINVGTYFHWWGNKVYDDIRSLSLFGSHLRYALMIVLALVFCVGWFLRKFPYRWIAVLLAGWFIYYTNLSQIGTGFLTLGGVVLLTYYLVVKRIVNRALKRTLVFLSVASILVFVGYLFVQLQPIPPKLEIKDEMYGTRTQNGTLYVFDLKENISWENGYPVTAFVAEEEIRKEWNKVSSIPFDDGQDLKGNPIKIILIRYMTSKGLKKDSVDFQKMSQDDIKNVEKGLTSIELIKGGLSAQLYYVRFQLWHPEDPNGKSLLERVEFVKNGLTLIRDHWFLGVGIGDLQQSFYEAYQKNKSKLLKENQHITHNQYLTTWIAGGVFCFLSFCFFWISQFRQAYRRSAFEWLGFLTIACLSFLIEDTLQTQTGVTFVAFFLGFFNTGRDLLYPGKTKFSVSK